jgi:hypothetical protein
MSGGGFNGQSCTGRYRQAPVAHHPVLSHSREWLGFEETKPMLRTTFGSIPWDDLHHTGQCETNVR